MTVCGRGASKEERTNKCRVGERRTELLATDHKKVNDSGRNSSPSTEAPVDLVRGWVALERLGNAQERST